MARSRNIKPGFFVNADLVELPPLVRLLFIGLWTIADRAGRLEDRPAQIKMQVLPVDDLDTVQALCMLGAKGFLKQYTVGGKAYIQIVNFNKHQNPHKAEQASVIPPPPDEEKPATKTNSCSNKIPASCKHRACLVLAGLIPDSLLLIPDSLTTTPMRVSDVSALYQKCAGVNVVNGGQVVVMQDFIKRFTPDAIEEAFMAAAAANISTAGFLNWCKTRMERGGGSGLGDPLAFLNGMEGQ